MHHTAHKDNVVFLYRKIRSTAQWNLKIITRVYDNLPRVTIDHFSNNSSYAIFTLPN